MGSFRIRAMFFMVLGFFSMSFILFINIMYFCMCWYGCKYHDQGAVAEHGSRSGSGTWFKER